MEYLEKFHKVVTKFLSDLGLKDVLVEIDIERMYINLMIKNLDQYQLIVKNLSILEKNLKLFRKNMKLHNVPGISSGVLPIKYFDNTLFTDKEKNELILYNYIIGRFVDYDIERIFEIEGELSKFYPFNKTLEDISNINNVILYEFKKYQRHAINNLTEYQFNFHLKLRRKFFDRRLSDQANLVIIDSDAFFFYEGEDGKVKTLIFNER